MSRRDGRKHVIDGSCGPGFPRADTSSLRDTKEEIVVAHTYNEYEGNDPKSGTYRVTSVTGRKASPKDGLYEVQLVEVPV